MGNFRMAPQAQEVAAFQSRVRITPPALESQWDACARLAIAVGASDRQRWPRWAISKQAALQLRARRTRTRPIPRTSAAFVQRAMRLMLPSAGQWQGQRRTVRRSTVRHHIFLAVAMLLRGILWCFAQSTKLLCLQEVQRAVGAPLEPLPRPWLRLRTQAICAAGVANQMRLCPVLGAMADRLLFCIAVLVKKSPVHPTLTGNPTGFSPPASATLDIMKEFHQPPP